jgi:carboxylate-amine ligase
MAVRTRSSVDDHRFGSSSPFTVGIEEEYMLLDPDTLDLVQRADTVLDADREGAFAGAVTCELFQSEIEGHTTTCSSVDDADAQLRRLREHLRQVLADAGLVLGSAGTHPFALYEDQRITDRERYHGIVEKVQYPARRELVFGLHVHVGVPDPETAVRVMNALQRHVPELVALSASSPFWRGLPTGLHSTRQSIFQTFPRSGLPPFFACYDAFAALVEALERAGLLEDYTRIWWDIRPHPRLGTVEIRAMDAVEAVEDAIALAAYVQALVAHYSETPQRPPSPLEHALTHENKWQAVRHGLDASVLDVARDGSAVPLMERIRRTLDEILFAAEQLGTVPYLAEIDRICADGTGGDRQLEAFRVCGDVRDAAREIVAATEGRSAWSAT